MVHAKEVKVFQYDPKEEVLLSEEKMNEAEVRKYKSGISMFILSYSSWKFFCI